MITYGNAVTFSNNTLARRNGCGCKSCFHLYFTNERMYLSKIGRTIAMCDLTHLGKRRHLAT